MANHDTSDTLKCRFCNYSVPRWRTLRDGTPRHGHALLNRHVDVNHPQEYERMIAHVLADEASAPDTLDE